MLLYRQLFCVFVSLFSRRFGSVAASVLSQNDVQLDSSRRQSAVDCATELDGNYTMPGHENDCYNFYVNCDAGVAQLRQCEQLDEFFEPKQRRCLTDCTTTSTTISSARTTGGPATLVETRTTLVSPTTTSEVRVGTTTAPLISGSAEPTGASNSSVDPNCFGRKNGYYLDAKQTNCSRFVLCMDGEGHEILCPKEQVFDSRQYGCRHKNTVPPPCGTGDPVGQPFNCSGLDDDWSYESNEADCRTYFRCEKTNETTPFDEPPLVPVRFECPEMEAFDVEKQLCVSMHTVIGCHPSGYDADLAEFCASKGGLDGFYEAPGNCNRAIICLSGFGYVHVCFSPKELYFDVQKRRCARHRPPSCEPTV